MGKTGRLPGARRYRGWTPFPLPPASSRTQDADREEAGGAPSASPFQLPPLASPAACTMEVLTLHSTVEFDSGTWWHVGFMFFFPLKHNVHILQPTYDTRFSEIKRSQYD